MSSKYMDLLLELTTPSKAGSDFERDSQFGCWRLRVKQTLPFEGETRIALESRPAKGHNKLSEFSDRPRSGVLAAQSRSAEK